MLRFPPHVVHYRQQALPCVQKHIEAAIGCPTECGSAELVPTENAEMCWVGMLSVIVARTSTYMLHSSMTHAHTRSNQPRDLPSQSSSHQRTTIECDQHDCAPFRVAGYQAKDELLPSTSTGLSPSKADLVRTGERIPAQPIL